MITVYADVPEENKETAEPQTCEGDRGRHIFEPSENLGSRIWRDFHQRRIFSRLPLTSELVLVATRSRSRENNTQLFSNTLAPLRYLTSKLVDLRSGYENWYLLRLLSYAFKLHLQQIPSAKRG